GLALRLHRLHEAGLVMVLAHHQRAPGERGAENQQDLHGTSLAAVRRRNTRVSRSQSSRPSSRVTTRTRKYASTSAAHFTSVRTFDVGGKRWAAPTTTAILSATRTSVARGMVAPYRRHSQPSPATTPKKSAAPVDAAAPI